MAYQVPADPTAVMGRRIGAFLVDLLVGVALFAALSWLTVDSVVVQGNVCPADRGPGSFDNSGPPTNEICVTDGGLVFFDNGESTIVDLDSSVGLDLALLAFGVGVFVVLQGVTGATPGKAAFGVRTVNAAGSRPGIGRALVRWLLWIVDWFPYCCVPVVGGIAALTTKGHRRIGDMAAGTYVVGKAMVGRPVVLPTDMPVAPVAPVAAPGTPAGAPGEPVWDPQRNRYVRWDPPSGRWQVYDDQSGQWLSE
jgi:uncharacterized RDD family membrane protein YckC